MAKRGPDEVFLLVGGYDLGQDSFSLDFDKSALMEETTVFGNTFTANSFVGVKRGVVNQEGYYDDADNRTSEALSDNSGTSRVMVVGFDGNTQGARAAGLAGAMQANFNRGVSRTEITKVAATFQSMFLKKASMYLPRSSPYWGI